MMEIIAHKFPESNPREHDGHPEEVKPVSVELLGVLGTRLSR